MGKLLPIRRVQGDIAEMTDDSLLAACALGDSAALGALFDRFHLQVYRFLSRFVGSGRADLDDLVQATFLEVMRSAPSFRGNSAVRTWIFGIAANLGRRAIRGEQRRRNLLAGLAERLHLGGPRPDESAERRQLVGIVGQAVAELPHDLRTAFVMCDLEEIPGVEVARVLGLREGTLWRRLHDARKRLRLALSSAEGEPR